MNTRFPFVLLSFLACAVCALAQDVVALPQNYEPCAVSNLQANVSTEGDEHFVTLRFTTPTQMRTYDQTVMDYVYAPLPGGISKVEILRSEYDMQEYAVVGTIEHPDVDATLEWKDCGADGHGLPLGRYDYRVITYVNEARSDLWNWDAISRGVVVGQVPAEFDETTAFVMKEGNTVGLSLTIPSVDTEGAPLTLPMRLEVIEMVSDGWAPSVLNLVHSEENVKAGSKRLIVLNDVKNGHHDYIVRLYTASGFNRGLSLGVFVGDDKPGTVENLKARSVEGGVLLTWTPPTKGQSGGDMGPVEDIRYKVYRKVDALGTEVLIADNVAETTFLDEITFDKETILYYFVAAVNKAGTGYNAESDGLLVGPASAIPYVEGFDAPDGYGGCYFEHNTWTRPSSKYPNWYPSIELDVEGTIVTPHTGDGLVYAMYSSWFGIVERWDALQTGQISFSGATAPTIELWLYDLDNGGSDLTFKVQYSLDGSSWVDVYSCTMGNAEESGWRQLLLDVPALSHVDKAVVRLFVEVSGKNVFPVVADEFRVYDAAATGVQGVPATLLDTRIHRLDGTVRQTLQRGINIISGKKLMMK